MQLDIDALAWERTIDVRMLIREGKWTGTTSGICRGYAQANVVILPQKFAYDFLLFCVRNPKPCPILEVMDAGQTEPSIAKGADIRLDVPKYSIYEKGKLVGESTDISHLWRDDFVTFLLGCSFSFEEALMKAGIPMRHIEEKRNCPIFITNIQCKPAGIFKGPLVVSMRPIPRDMIIKAVQITSRYPFVHGAPISIGDPETIGIKDITKPDFGDPVTIYENEVPVFWACGVTPQAVAINSKVEIMITHAPTCMFITDVPNEKLAAI